MKRLAASILFLSLFSACDDARKPLIGDVHLQRFSSCQALDHARVLRTNDISFGTGVEMTAADAPAANATAGAVKGETNIQVAGVDELDVAKADGDLIFRLGSDGTSLSVLKRSPAGAAAVLQKIDLGEIYAQGIFLTASKVIVLGSSGSWGVSKPSDPWGGVPVAVAFSSADPRKDVVYPDPVSEKIHVRYFGRNTDGTLSKEVGLQEIDGQLVDARLIGTFLHIAASRYIGAIVEGSGNLATDQPKAVLPQASFASANQTFQLADCTDILHEPAAEDPGSYTPSPPGIDNLFGVVSIDTDKADSPPQSVWIGMNYSSTLYASTDNLFVASFGWDQEVPIHQFRLANGSVTTDYVGSALIEGQLLNQYSMDEYQGHLRVATSLQPLFQPLVQQEGVMAAQAQVAANNQIDNKVAVFRLTGGDLEKVGEVAGLGVGERIYAVRFLESRGFVVTFRQIDPLFALDLADPANPKLRGELKVSGFSNYLHPMGDGYLLGLGKNANEAGQVHLGMLLSLFDVRDLDHPQLLHKIVIGSTETSSAAEHDPHAFRYIPETSQLVLPVDLMDASWNSTPKFQIYKVSLTDGFSLVGSSALREWDNAPRSFFHDGVIDLIGGGDMVLRSADQPNTDLAKIAIE
jgi:inhibitor of cysteine peptidase